MLAFAPTLAQSPFNALSGTTTAGFNLMLATKSTFDIIRFSRRNAEKEPKMAA